MGDDDGADQCGAAYVYRYDGIEWVEEAKLLPDDAELGVVFRKLAAAELTADRTAKKQFPDHRWSQQDRRAEIMHNRTRQIAKYHELPVAMVYLIHQKGISERWPGPDGKPLEAEIVPRKSRQW